MTKDNSFEMIPGVCVTEADTIEYNHGKRLDLSKYKQLDRNLNGSTYSDAQVRDKIGKNKGWAICRSWSNVKDKLMNFEVLINAHDTEIRTVNYKEICESYGWKSFDWSEDGQSILPVK